MYKKIVVPLDGSELAECVLPHVENIAKAMGTEEVILITVMERVVDLTPKKAAVKSDSAVQESWTDIAFSDRPYTGKRFEFDPSLKIPVVTGKMLKQGQRYLAQVAEPLVKNGVKAGITVLMGEAAEQIVDFAADEKRGPDYHGQSRPFRLHPVGDGQRGRKSFSRQQSADTAGKGRCRREE